MSPARSGATWYDLLGVDRDATPTQIKAAWRDATDRFEPGSGTSQFRLFNEAADVLLDPGRRAEYDAELGATDAPPAVDAVAAPGAPVTLEKAPPTMVVHTVRQARAADSAPASPSKRRTQRERGTTGGVPVWVLAVLTVLVVAAAAVGATFAVKNRADSREDDAGQEASAAAERALPAVLSYDYRRLDADQKRADPFLTAAYRKEYDATFAKLIKSNGTAGPAVQTKAVVKATVENVGVVAAQPDRVRVIAFVNQTTTKGTAAPTLSLNRLTVSMRKVGNAWLLEDIVSY